MEEQTKTRLTLGGLILGFLVVIGFAGYMLFIGNAVVDNSGSQTQTTSPPTDAIASWNTVGNSSLGFTFKYPNNFFDAGHQPQVVTRQCSTDPGCASGQNVTVNGAQYCHVQTQDAAAGSQFYTDLYTTVKNGQCIDIQLDTKTTTCENYLPIEQGNTQQQTNYDDCIKHRTDRPNIINQIVNTFTFTK